MCGSALDEGGRAASRKLMGGHKTPPLFSRQGLEDRSSLAIFFTYERGFFDRRSGFFYVPRFFDHHDLKPYY
jgi:hypothetical protein